MMPSNFSNKIFLFPLVAVASLIIGLFLFAKFGPSIPISMIATNKTDLFTVTGEGKATAVPDIAQITLGITISSQSVSAVQSQANNTINSVTAAVKKAGVGDKDIQTTNYNLRPDYDSTSRNQTIKGYIADINLTVKVRQFDKINQVIDAATAAGANQVGGLTFTLDDATQLKAENEARQKAIDQAKNKANQIAAASGLNLGRIVNVTEGQNSFPRPMLMTGAGKADSTTPETQIQPGSSEISVFVTLSYETR